MAHATQHKCSAASNLLPSGTRLQETYLHVPAAGLGWLPPPSPDTANLLCSLVSACSLMLAAGLLSGLAALVLLLLCWYLAAVDQDPGSQLNSLLLQLGVINCLLPLGRYGCRFTLKLHGPVNKGL